MEIESLRIMSPEVWDNIGQPSLLKPHRRREDRRNKPEELAKMLFVFGFDFPRFPKKRRSDLLILDCSSRFVPPSSFLL
jgi:hypothetical protein